MAGAAELRIRLLGGFAAETGGVPVPERAWRLRKARELVKLLALADQHRLHREQAMELLWPGRDPESAANNLNQVVHAARRALGADAIAARDGLLRLQAVVDVDAFERSAAAARRDGTARAYGRAVALYGGELLPENRYDDWAAVERERLAALHDELEAEHAALGGSVETPRRLPLDASTFVGREQQLADLRTLLRHTRLLTLSGTGGVGKTRLALELARGAERGYADGAVLAELDAVADGTRVADAVAEALDVRALPGGVVVDALVAELASRELLLVLDNCEHVIAGSAALAGALLREAPRLTILATSREPLRVPGEVVRRVPSLTIADPDLPAGPSELLRYEAVRFFVERAAEVAPGFTLGADTAPHVARICHRLDGLPLALELAAARIGALEPEAVARRLDDRFRLLRAGSRTAPTRQQTLEAALDWSYELLVDAERTLFRRLAIFAGGFGLEAVEDVCTGDELERAGIADLLGRLVEKSLVASDDRAGRRRYRLLETIRAYAAACLGETGERRATAARHAQWLTELAESQDARLAGLEAEQGNVRVALETLLEQDAAGALHLCALVWPFWLRRLELAEARRWLGESLDRSPEPTVDRIRALLGHAAIEYRAGDEGFGLGRAEEALTLARTLDEPELEWRAVHFCGGVAIAADDGAGASRHYEPALALARARGLAAAEAVSVYSLGVAAWAVGDLDVADERCAESLGLFERLTGSTATVPALLNVAEIARRDPHTAGLRLVFEDTLQPFAELSCSAAAGYVLLNWANVARAAGDSARAHDLLARASACFEQVGSDSGRADAWARLANVALAEGRLDEAAGLFERARGLRERLGDRRGLALALVGLGRVAIDEGRHGRAARLLQEGADTFRRAGDRWGLASTLWRVADLELERGRPDAAEERLEEALRVVDETRRVRWQAVTRTNLAEVVLRRGDDVRARLLLEEARAGFEAVGDAQAARYVGTQLTAAAKAAQR